MDVQDCERRVDGGASLALACTRSLRETPPRLPSKYLYDAKGSALFEEITALPEYTLTRDELAVFDGHLGEMAEAIGPGAWVIEPGSGDGRKTHRLLEALERPAGYTSIEISRVAIEEMTRDLRAAFPGLNIEAVRGDFTAVDGGADGDDGDDGAGGDVSGGLEMPEMTGEKRVVFFPGSTIGNFDEDDACLLMERFARWVGSGRGPGGGLLIGADLVKPEAEMVAAYSDKQGVTAEFNLNLLDRLNAEAGGESGGEAGAGFDRAKWTHRATWNPERSRMESHLVSTADQRVRVGDEVFAFADGDSIRTEVSKKYTPESLERFARPFEMKSRWFDPARRFMVAYLEVPA